MKYRQFGNTGLRVSEIGVGCGGLGGERKMGLEPALERAMDLGVNFFDTCDTYAESRSEQTLGRVFLNHPRDRFVVCTKFGGVIENDEWRRDISVRHLHEAFAASCRRLNVDYFDIYLVHTPPRDILAHGDLIEALGRMVEQGKIRTFGLSVEQGDFATEFVSASPGRAIEIAFSLFAQDPRNGFLEVARKLGVGVICKSPMRNGVLTDSFRPDPAPGDRRLKSLGPERHARMAALWRQVQPILTAGGRTMAQGALAWLLSFPQVSTVIPGVVSLERIEETAAASDRPMSADELAALDAAAGGALVGARVD
ncbi:MAG: NADH-specific methylglyoxal reductase [Phycisphaerae bacterium]|nr:NADH-specific methylglyoxal reductase [Phycisphaerae bacterium]